MSMQLLQMNYLAQKECFPSLQKIFLHCQREGDITRPCKVYKRIGKAPRINEKIQFYNEK